MNILLKILEAIVPKTLRLFIQKRLPSMEKGKSNGATEQALKRKIDEQWKRK